MQRLELPLETKHPRSSKYEAFLATSQSSAAPDRSRAGPREPHSAQTREVSLSFRPLSSSVGSADTRRGPGRSSAQLSAAPPLRAAPRRSRPDTAGAAAASGRSRAVPCRAVPCRASASTRSSGAAEDLAALRARRDPSCGLGPGRGKPKRPSEPRMDFLPLLLLYLCLVLAVAVLYCSHAGSGGGRLGRAARTAGQVLSLVIPTRIQSVTQKVLLRLFHTRNYLFVVLHIALQAAVYAEYTWEVFVYCWELEFHLVMLLLPYLLLAGNVGCFILCSCANPGVITKSNHASLMKTYAYDGVLFQKGTVCATCNMEKPARSKHCSFCDICVHRFDHHCVWVNNCIGAFNAKYFFLYLFTLTVMAATIASITAAFLIQVVLLSNMMHGSYIDDQGQEHAVEIPFLVQHLFLTFPRIVFMLGFVILLTLIVGAYCCFNLYLALTNQTFNEWYKCRRYRHSHHLTLQPCDRQVVYKNVYAKGVWMNLKEIFKSPAVLERKKKK